MMRSTIVGCCIAASLTSITHAQVLVDDFNDNVKAAFWMPLVQGTGPLVAEVNGRLEISLPADSIAAAVPGVPQTGFSGGYLSSCRLRGDFDFQIEYTLLTWPSRTGAGAALQAFMDSSVPSIFVSRFSNPGAGEQYYASVDFATGNFVTIPTGDSKGALRVSRFGTTGSAYYLSQDGSQWIRLTSGQVATRDALVNIGVGAFDSPSGGQFIMAALDNFRLNQGQLTCPVKCGDGVIEPGEECDDGNLAASDGCDPQCRVETCFSCGTVAPSTCAVVSDGTPCNDENPCSSNDVCSQGACVGTAAPPAPNCRSARSSSIAWKRTGGAKDKLDWKWVRGQSTTQQEFEDPTQTTPYSFCIYAGSASVAAAQVPPASTKWRVVGSKGYKYTDSKRVEDGIQIVTLTGGSDTKAKVEVHGKGPNLPAPILPFEPPVTIQLFNDDTGTCWGAVYDAEQIKRNTTDQFKASATQ